MALRKNRLALSISHALWMGAFAATGAAQAQQAAQDGAKSGDDQVITVTAQSRVQQAQAVPISLQMVTADQLGKLEANNLAEVNGYIPGLVINADQPTQPGYSIRGIGTSDFGTASSPQIYAEASLDSTLQSGQLDASSAFITQAVELKLPYVKLPDQINLGSAAEKAAYAKATVTVKNGKTYKGSPQVIDITTVEHVSFVMKGGYVFKR